MKIRRPRFEDIDQLLSLGAQMHAEGAYAFLPYDSKKVQDLIIACIEDDGTYYGLVAEDDGILVGMVGGYLTDYFFCDEKLACDLALFIDRDRRGSVTAIRLIHAFRKWAIARGARELCLSISNGVDIDVTGKLYQRLGLKHVGGVYKQRLKGAQA